MTITVSAPDDLRVFQRSSGQHSVPVGGTYTGTPSAIQARVVLHGTSTEVVGWSTIDAAPSGGTYGGAITVPQGGWYNIQVRQFPDTLVTAESSNRFGVGAVFCAAGQSNAMHWFSVGTGTPTETTSKYAGSWSANTGAGAIAFGNAMAAALGVPVGLVDTGIDGAALTLAGNRGAGYWLDTGGTPWTTWATRVSAAGGKLEGILWLQGESDALQGVTTPVYSMGLAKLFSEMRMYLGQTLLPVFTAPLSRSAHADSTDEEWNAVNDAILAFDTPNVTLACDTWDLPQADALHYSEAGYATLANRFALAVRAKNGESVASRGPAIVGVIRGTTTADIVVGHRGGADIAPSTGATGFRFTDAGVQVVPTNVARVSPTTFRATFGAALTGPLVVAVAWGQQTAVTDPARDNTGLPVQKTPASGVALDATFYLAIYPAGAATPTWDRANVGTNSGWSGSPVYTDSDVDPGTGTTYQFTPDASGLSAGTSYDAYAVWEDGSTVVGPVSALGWSTASASVSGTLSATETGADSATFSGAVLVSGNFATSESGSDTAVLSGVVLVAGTLSATEVGDDVFAAGGAGQVAGTLSATESGADILASSGAVLVSGNLSVTESGSDTFFAIDGNFVSGTLSAQESGNDTFQASSGGYTITFAQAQLLSQIYLLHGLGSPLSVAPTSRAVAGLSQEITSLSGTVTIKTLTQESAVTTPVGTMLEELAALHGITVDLVVTPTSRAAGSISQIFTTVGSQTTVTRQ